MSNPSQITAPEIRNAPHETDPNLKNPAPQIYNYGAARQARRKEQAAQEQYERQSPSNLSRERTVAGFAKDADLDIEP